MFNPMEVCPKFTGLVKYSLKEFINDRITDRLKSAIELPDPANSPSTSTEDPPILSDNEIVTTAEEMEAFYSVKSILREVIDVSCVQYKDTKTYFGINLNGKNFKTICRFRLSSSIKKIGLLDLEGKEAMKTISSLDEIYGVAEILKDRAKYLSGESYVPAFYTDIKTEMKCDLCDLPQALVQKASLIRI